ncbi:hypothetical protein F5Y15DRAFT_75762 [Xylariaceae sp. FL0016]|nr:hypothetical protein F5Y15DRAFT_75762 [Xylariaceae sp. FL0016]
MADMSPPLLRMPVEVLLHISSHLTTLDYGSLRRTCKHVENFLFRAFAKEFFSKRQFCLTDFSLQALLDISESRLAPSLTHVIIHLERPAARGRLHGNPPSDPSKWERFAHEYYTHKALVDTGRDVELLKKAFSGLPNLETIGIRDFNSNKRTRDDTFWNSYGSQTFIDLTGRRLEKPHSESHDGEETAYTCHVFLTILRALGSIEACDSRPSRIEVIMRGAPFSERALYMPPYLDPITSRALANLQTLFLDRLQRPHLEHSTFPQLCILPRFFLKAQGLQHLRLNFLKEDRLYAEAVLGWLSQDNGSLGSTFPNLQHLDLGMIAVGLNTLLGVYKRYKKTLRSISLHKVTLPVTFRDDERFNTWSDLLSQMATLNLELSKMSIGWIKVGDHAVSFNGGPFKEWSGRGMEYAAKDFMTAMSVDWPPERPAISVSESSSSIMEDEDESGSDDDVA